VIEVNECVGPPEPLAQLLARDDFAGSLQQRTEHLEWLLLQPNSGTTLAQFPRLQVRFKEAKRNESPAADGLRN
jgi:hypothetical protein